jgi:hypothetical protein
MQRPLFSLTMAALAAGVMAFPARGQGVRVYAPRAGVGAWMPTNAASGGNPSTVTWARGSNGWYTARQGLGRWRPTGSSISNPQANTWQTTAGWVAGPPNGLRGVWVAPYPGRGPSTPAADRWSQEGSGRRWTTFRGGAGMGVWTPPATGPTRPENNSTWRVVLSPREAPPSGVVQRPVMLVVRSGGGNPRGGGGVRSVAPGAPPTRGGGGGVR